MYVICLLHALALPFQVQIGYWFGAWPAIWFSVIIVITGAILFGTLLLVLLLKMNLQEPWLMLSSGTAGLMALLTQSAALVVMFHPNDLDQYLPIYAAAKALSWVVGITVIGGLVKSSIDGTPKKPPPDFCQLAGIKTPRGLPRGVFLFLI